MLYWLGRVVELAVVSAICLTVFALMMPNIKESVQEARIRQAWGNVRQIRKSLDNPSGKDDLPVKDPWGQPYLNRTLPDGSIRILSTGANKATTEDGPDADDIYSDMPTSPLDPFSRRRAFEWSRAYFVAGGLWILFLLAWVYEGRRRAKARAAETV